MLIRGCPGQPYDQGAIERAFHERAREVPGIMGAQILLDPARIFQLRWLCHWIWQEREACPVQQESRLAQHHTVARGQEWTKAIDDPLDVFDEVADEHAAWLVRTPIALISQPG